MDGANPLYESFIKPVEPGEGLLTELHATKKGSEHGVDICCRRCRRVLVRRSDLSHIEVRPDRSRHVWARGAKPENLKRIGEVLVHERMTTEMRNRGYPEAVVKHYVLACQCVPGRFNAKLRPFSIGIKFFGDRGQEEGYIDEETGKELTHRVFSVPGKPTMLIWSGDPSHHVESTVPLEFPLWFELASIERWVAEGALVFTKSELGLDKDSDERKQLALKLSERRTCRRGE